MSPVHSSSWWSTASTSNPSTVAGLLTSEATTERRRRPRRGCATSSPSWSPRGSRWSCTTGSLTSSSSTTTSGAHFRRSLAPSWLTLLKCFQQASMIPSTLQTLSPGLRCRVRLKKQWVACVKSCLPQPQASYLEFVFRKEQRSNQDKAAAGRPHVKVRTSSLIILEYHMSYLGRPCQSGNF